MTIDQVLALVRLIADQEIQIAALQQEAAQLRETAAQLHAELAALQGVNPPEVPAA